MEVRMEHTEGFARKAEILLNNESLIVCDSVSTPEQRCMPGVIDNAQFTYPSLEGFEWPQAIRDNPSSKVRLEHVSGWSYIGFGRVMSIMPVTIDFGILTLVDPNWCSDERLTGRYVKVSIDRLELGVADGNQWPEDLRPSRRS